MTHPHDVNEDRDGGQDLTIVGCQCCRLLETRIGEVQRTSWVRMNTVQMNTVLMISDA